MERHFGQREEGRYCEDPKFWNDLTHVPRLNDARLVRKASLDSGDFRN